MKVETRIEIVILIAGAVIGGGWLGLRFVRSRSAAAKASNPAKTSTPPKRIMTAPPAAPPKRRAKATPKPAPRVTTKRKPTPRKATPAPKVVSITKPKPQPAPSVSRRDRTLLTGTDGGGRKPDKRDKPKPAPDLAKAQKLLADGKKFEARAELTRLILVAPEGGRRQQIHTMLDTINQELFFSSAPSPDATFYTVKEGDTLWGIVKQYKKDFYFSRLIMQINGIQNAKRIRPGRRLKIPQGRFSAICQKDAHRLTVLLEGHYVREYRIAIGAPTAATPSGAFVIDTKEVNPDWYSHDGHLYKYGDPRNILGTRWIGFKDTPEYQSYGIHGTSKPESIGKNVSKGCIRMLNAEVEEVFGMLMAGDRVVIQE